MVAVNFGDFKAEERGIKKKKKVLCLFCHYFPPFLLDSANKNHYLRVFSFGRCSEISIWHLY